MMLHKGVVTLGTAARPFDYAATRIGNFLERDLNKAASGRATP
jgi:hypothetical protein